MNKVRLCHIQVHNVNMPEAVGAVEEMLAGDGGRYVVPVNVDVLVRSEKNPVLLRAIEGAHLVLADGMPLVWMSRLFKTPVKERVSGSDLVPALCRVAAEKGYTVFFLGGREGVAKQAAENLARQLPGIRVVGVHAPSFGFMEDPAEIAEVNQMISRAAPDLLIVCLGCPKQERFILENRRRYRAGVSICAGATVDFLAGSAKRAPEWMRRAGLEWFHRFLRDPARMFRRYFIDDLRVLRLILLHGKEGRRRAARRDES